MTTERDPDPCPFCGSDYVAVVEMPPAPSHCNTERTFHVECKACGMWGPQSRAPQTREGAVLAWAEIQRPNDFLARST